MTVPFQSSLVVRISGLRYSYPGAQEDVLRIPQLEIWSPGMTAITGPSGAGKSTLVEILAGTLREPFEGDVSVLGVDLSALERDADRQRHIRRIGLIPQDFGLLPGRTVSEILAQDLSDSEIPARETPARIELALEQVDLRQFADRPSSMLSGGQRQRVAIARMLARDVELIIADEPTANLDPALVGGVMALFRELAATRAVVIVTHDGTVAALCGRTVVLQSAANPVFRGLGQRVPHRRRAVIGGWAGLCLGAAGIVVAGFAFITRGTSATTSSESSSVGSAQIGSAQPPGFVSKASASSALSSQLARAGALPSSIDRNLIVNCIVNALYDSGTFTSDEIQKIVKASNLSDLDKSLQDKYTTNVNTPCIQQALGGGSSSSSTSASSSAATSSAST